jgi:hypothetical protein
VITGALIAAACTTTDDDTEGQGAAPPETSGTVELALEAPDRCEHFDAGGCLLPFPSDHFTVEADTPTGRTIALDESSMPANVEGTPVDPTEWNRNDGFSAGSLIVLVVPGLDPAASSLPPVTDIEASIEDDSSLVVIDTDTGDRVPAWAELDAQDVGEPAEGEEITEAPTVAGEHDALLIHPARNLVEGHRHVVALRGLVDGDGTTIEASPGFAAYRDGLGTDVEAVEDRRAEMEQVFTDLDAAGVSRDDLFLAWDFTVASTDDRVDRLLAMRDDGFAAIDDGTPAFTVTATEDEGGVRRVEGTFEVPSFLTDEGGPGTVLNNGDAPDGIPEQNGSIQANFLCFGPAAPAEPGPAVLYGHGLLGGAGEVESVGTIAAGALGATACATDWIGMSRADIGPISEAIGEFSDFRIVPDRLQQAHLNFLFLGRLLVSPDGFAADPAFQGPSGAPAISGEVQYVGASQGGILGGATSAVATDWDRAALIVPGQDYATLLDRSVDFDAFDTLMVDAYPDPVDRQLLLSLAQILWDRGENDGYSQHLTDDPLPGSEAKRVLLVAAFGDHQVANVATDSLARTAEIPLRVPGLAEGRSADVEPFWGIETITEWPHTGSAYLMFDFGTPPPPTANVPNRAGDDPHGAPAESPEALGAIIAFLLQDQMDDPCPADEPCGEAPR